MAAKPETTFYNSVHKKLPSLSKLYRVKMSNPYVGGIPDFWYSNRSDLWVEWKYLNLPVRDDTIIHLIAGRNPPITALQREWLRDRHAEGRSVWVIVGSDAGGGIVFKSLNWEYPFTAGWFRTCLMSREAIANEIVSWVSR